jgi:hypothetical protein
MPVVPPDRDPLDDRAQASLDIHLEPADNERLANLCGQFDENLRHLEERLGVRIGNRGNHFHLSGPSHFHLSGPSQGVEGAAAIINSLYELAAEEFISPDRVPPPRSHTWIRRAVGSIRGAAINPNTCVASGNWTSISGLGQLVPARPTWRSAPRSRRWRPNTSGG